MDFGAQVALRCCYCGEVLLPDLSSLPWAQMRRRIAGHVRRHRDRGDDLSDARANAVVAGVGWSGAVWAVVPPSGVLVNLPTEPDSSGAPPAKQPPGDPATVRCYTAVVEWSDGSWSQLMVPLDAETATRLVETEGEVAALYAARDPDVSLRLFTDPREALLAIVSSSPRVRPSRS